MGGAHPSSWVSVSASVQWEDGTGRDEVECFKADQSRLRACVWWGLQHSLSDSPFSPKIRIQGLDVSGLQGYCQESPGVFPSDKALHGLGRRGFLGTLNTTLGHVLHRLTAFQQDLPKFQALGTAKMYIYGVRNNIHCMAQLLRGSSETAEPTQAGPGASPPPTPASDTFQRKLEGCRFLSGYHRFMHSVGQVFRRWRESPSRSRRHSPRRALRKGAHRMQPSMRGKKLVGRGQLPR